MGRNMAASKVELTPTIGNNSKVWLTNWIDNSCKEDTSRPPTPSLFVALSKDGKILANPRFKTEICRNFKERNKCVYGDRCQFAHGRRELREVVQNSKQNYAKNIGCPDIVPMDHVAIFYMTKLQQK